MPGPLEAAGALKNPTRFASLGMGARQFTGLVTQRSPYRDGAVPYLVGKFYGGTRFDTIIDGVNREITQRMTDKRRPGHSVYNSQTFPAIQSWYAWKYIQNKTEQLRVMVDTAANVYDGTSSAARPNTKLNIWNKNAGSGATRFLGVNTELFFNDGIEPKKWVESALTWAANTLYDGAATSDTPLGDYILDTNGNLQQAVGGFLLLISMVSVAGNVLTLTLDTSQLADPSGTPTGTPATSGGSLTAGNHFIRICGVDATGNVTEAGNESAAAVTTGAAGQIVWTWPAISGAVGYRIYVGSTTGGETTYFTSATNSFTQTLQTSTVSGTPPVANSTSVSVPDNLYSMVGVELALSGLTTATFLNGQTVTITGVLPGGQQSNQITAAFTHADYGPAADTGQATSGTGITGGTQPTWATTLWAVTQDGGAQWINRGSQIENWGIATPAAAPTVSQSPAPVTYPSWAANTSYWRSGFTVQYTTFYAMFQLTTPGTTGASLPTWNTSTIGATTTDGTAVWTYRGPAVFSPSTPYVEGAYVGYQAPSSVFYLYKAKNAGVSAAAQGVWTTVAGQTVVDNSILWECLGSQVNENLITPSRNVSTATEILDSNGYLQQIQDLSYSTSSTPAGGYASGSVQPVWGVVGATTAESIVATITAFQVFGGSNAAEMTTVNNEFAVGQAVTVTGLSVGTYLNGTWTIGPEGPVSTNFFFSIVHGSVGTTSDSGTATVSQPNMWLNIGAYAPVSTQGSYYAYSYGNSVTNHVSTASGKSALTLLTAGNQANVAGFGSADPQVDTIWLWATVEGGSTLIFMDKIANPGGGVPFSYTRTMPDVSTNGGPQLNPFLAAPVAESNDPPPLSLTAPVWHLQRVWGIVDNTVVYSGGPDTLVGSGSEAFPPLNSIPYIAQPIFLMPVTVQNGGLLVFTTSGIWIILGTGTSSNPFYTTSYYSSVNVLSYDAVTQANNAAFVMESNGKVSSVAIEYPFNPQTGYTEVGFPIGEQFLKTTTGGQSSALFNPASTYVSWNMANTADTGMYVANGAGFWFRMSVINPPESGLLWSPLAQIAGGTSAVMDVETVPGTHTLLLGPATSGPILQRDVTGTVWTDNGTAYPAWDAKGVIELCSTGQWSEIGHIATKSMAVGARPVISTLFGEIVPSAARAYTPLNLADKSNDPPRNKRSLSAFSDRYNLKQNGVENTGDVLLVKFDYGSQAVADELLKFEIYGAIHQENEEMAQK